MPDQQRSALERRQMAEESTPFPNVEIFYELVGGVLAELHSTHPVPQYIDPRSHLGSIVSQDTQLADVFRWTEDFLRSEGIIRGIEPDNSYEPMRYVLTMLGLKLLASPTSELSPPESAPSGILMDTLKTYASGIGDEAAKSIVRAAVAGALAIFARYMR